MATQAAYDVNETTALDQLTTPLMPAAQAKRASAMLKFRPMQLQQWIDDWNRDAAGGQAAAAFDDARSTSMVAP